MDASRKNGTAIGTSGDDVKAVKNIAKLRHFYVIGIIFTTACCKPHL